MRISKSRKHNTTPPLLSQGFTLAEILITLVIIGVIAAATIPTMINNTKKQEYVSALKKTYSTLATVTNKIMNDEGMPRGDIGGWATSHSAEYNVYKKYLSYVKACNSGSQECFGQGGFKHLNNTAIDASWGAFEYPKLILSDGTQLIFVHRTNDCSQSSFGSQGICFTIGIDVNGEKPPNAWGKDAFIFVVKEDGLHPAGCDGTGCPNSSGTDCACKVLRENAINY